MLDNGTNSDDIMGDSIYSYATRLHNPDEGVYTYTASYMDENGTVVSNEIEISIYAPLTPKELEDMKEVDSFLLEWFESFLC